MTKTIHTVKTLITEDDFIKLKEVEPFASMRQDSKAINFGLLFGMGAPTYSRNSLETKWSVEKIEKFIGTL